MRDGDALDLRTGVAIAGWALALHYLVSLTASGWGVPSGVPTVAGAATIVAVVALATPGPRRGARLGLRVPRARYVIAAILVGPTSGFAIARFGPWLADLVHAPPIATSVTSFDLVPALLIGAVLAPVAEELLFRGVALRTLATIWSWPRAGVASALFFALYHHNPYQLIVPFVDGVILGYLALKSGSIVPGMVMHALHNASVALQSHRAPAGLWDWVSEHHDALLGPAALIAFAGVVIAARGEPTG